MKIATWNVNGIRARQAQVQEFMASEHPDVLCLQEIKASAEQIPPFLCEMEGYWCYWHGTSGYSGVGLHVSRTIAPERPAFSHPAFDYENRIVLVSLPQVTVASVYVPNGGKDYPAKLEFLQALVAWAGETQRAGRALVLCGDLNVAREDRDVHPKERKPNLVGTRPEERTLLAGLLDQDLVDVGRTLDPGNDHLFTWWAPWRNLRQRNIGWRIDYVLAHSSLASRAERASSMREFGTSDHAPVVASLS
jgi:exodeoxyribonuclease-3